MLRSLPTFVAALLLAASVCFPQAVLAQESESRRTENAPQKSGAGASLTERHDAAPQTRLRGQTRIDVQSGLVRAQYDQAARHVYVRPESFLENESSVFGWSKDVGDLVLVDDQRRPQSRHLTYQQTFRGLPVAGRKVRVNMDRQGRVSMVTSAFEAVKADEPSFDILPTFSADAASSKALSELAAGIGLAGSPRLVIHNPAAPRLAWELTVWPESEPAEYKVWIDAQSGAILESYNQVLFKGDHSAHQDPFGHADDQALRTDGSGYVFDPDPLFTSGASYGPPYLDNDDATNAELNAARKTVSLLDISEKEDGKWVLEGPYVRITGENTAGTTVYDPPAANSPNDFFYDRSDERFEAVNAYYHIDASQRYIQSLGILDIQNEGLDVNPHGFTRDDSAYYPDRNMIMFGSGGVDDAEDPSVVIHEYGHAVLNAAAPGLLSTFEGRALHEGFADYWQGSYYRNLVETGQTARDDWRWVFLWDSGEGQIWNGRYLDHAGIYPQDICTASTNGAGCSWHEDGRMWATTLMQVWDELGRDVTDHLVLLSHYYLESPVTFSDAAQAVVQADFDYYDGAHAGTLIDIFSARGLVNASQYGPVIEHEPLLSTEESDVSVPVEAMVRGVSGSIEQVDLTWSSRTMAEQTISLASVGGDLFRGELQLPASTDTVFYYISARDQIGNTTYEPAGAPQESHSFVVGVDDGPPLLVHQPVLSASFLEWPVHINGSAQDNFGIASVELAWELSDPDGQFLLQGSTVLSETNGVFDGPIPIPLSMIENGSRVTYFITATDASTQKNASRVPETGSFSFDVSAGSILREYGFESLPDDFAADGEWEVAVPEYGMRVSPGGGAVAATNAQAAYTDQPSVSIMELPALNLARIEPAHMQFWHFFDTEAQGRPDPSSTGANLFDGGFLQIRTASNSEWKILNPDSGYPGTLMASGQNPMVGQPAYGGFSKGWRRVRVPLPQEDGVRIRFVFATGQGNTAQADRFAGWMIEDLSIGTQEDSDQADPVFAEVPAAIQVYSTQEALPVVEAQVTDDLGIQNAWMDWSLTSGSILEEGSVRMTQSMDDLSRFSAATDFLLTTQPGDQLTISLRADDPGGHAVDAGPFSITFRLFGTEEALSSVWANGNWEVLGDGWVFRTQPTTALSGLVLNPRDTEANAAALSLVVDHEPNFSNGSAGLVEVSDDGGSTWQELTPINGYPGTARLDPNNPLNDRSAFVGTGMRMDSEFDLSAWKGEQLQVRFLATSEEGGSANQHWRLFSALFKAQTNDAMFEQAVQFELHDAFPNPFADRTRLTWSIEESGPVNIQVYDSIGRQVAIIVDSYQQAGTHAATWDAAAAPAGVYFVRLQANGQQATSTIVRVGR